MFPKSSGLRKQADVKTVERHADFIEFATDHNRDRAELWVERVVGVADSVRYILSPRMRLEVAILDLTDTLMQLAAKDDCNPQNATFTEYINQDNTDVYPVRYYVGQMPMYQNSPSMAVTFGSDDEGVSFFLNGEICEISDRALTGVIRNMNQYALGQLDARTDSST